MGAKTLFYFLSSPQEKVRWLVQRAQAYYNEKKPLQIVVQDLAVAEYVDRLLWQSPQDGFLPHSIEDFPCQDPIVISWVKKNLNKAKVLLNITGEALDFAGQEEVCELVDTTKESWKDLLQAKETFYSAQGREVLRIS